MWVVVIVVLAVVAGGGVMLYQSTTPEQSKSGQFLEDGTPTKEPGPFIQERGTAPTLTMPAITPVSSTAAAASPALRAVSAPTGKKATVAMTDTGFSPATVTVAAGTAVTFVNNGQGTHWPASAAHPTHKILSGFDALRGLPTGEQYSFTFNQKGTWQFHDHLNPQFTGSVIVE